MKNLIFLLVLFSFVACKSVKENPNEISIVSKKSVVGNDYSIRIDEIISDSRCPENVNCIWAGELVVQLSVWQNEVLKETKVITFGTNTKEENIEWFSKFIPEGKKLKLIRAYPIKTEKNLVTNDYKIDLILE